MAGGKAFCPFSVALFAGSAFSYIAYLRQKKQATLPSRCIDVHKQTYIIAGDIGGTNSRFALHLSGQKDPLLVHVYSNEDSLKTTTTFHHATLKPFLEKCLAEVEAWKALGEKEVLSKIQVVACLATAGPVTMDNDVFMVNLGESGGSIDGNEIEKCQDGLLSLVVRCKLVNDFVGQGYGVLDLDLDEEVIELLPGSKAKVKDLGPICCVGAGTGLGECFLTKSSLAKKLGYECYPSEGGHSDFTPRGPLEVELVDYLKEKFSCDYRVSVERIVSGRGLANVYEFLANKFPDRVDTLVHEEFLAAGDQQGRVVGINSQIDGSLTQQAMQIMAAAYGAEAGNAALKFIPTGGLFLTGGLTPKNIGMIKGDDSPFMKAYLDKGRLNNLIRSIPLFAVLNEDVGLRGARVCAEREYNAM